MSTWIETSRQSPIFRMGISSIRYASGVAGCLRSTTALPERRSASANASAMVALDTTFSSTPRCTIVCAICGRMPLMMQSAPISRAAEMVLIRCCATSVSTVGTPVMSMMAISAPEVDDALQQALHDDLGARAVERADQRQREDAVPQLDHRRRELEQFLLLAGDHLLADPRVAFDGVEAEPVDQSAGGPGLVGEPVGVVAELPAQQLEQRLLQREDEHGGLARAVSPAWRGRARGPRATRASAAHSAVPISSNRRGLGATTKLLEEAPRQFARSRLPAVASPHPASRFWQASQSVSNRWWCLSISERMTFRCSLIQCPWCVGSRNGAANRAAPRAESKCHPDPCAAAVATVRMALAVT